MSNIETFDALYEFIKEHIDAEVKIRTVQLENEISRLKKDKEDLIKLLMETADTCNMYKDMVDIRQLGDDLK